MTENRVYSGPHFTVGMIGAAGQGKTTLLHTLLKVQADKGKADHRLYNNLIEQSTPGEIIAVEYESPRNYFYTHIDCAGGEEYTESMMTAMERMEYAILVISVVNGVTRFTHEHVRLAREAGIRAIVVYMNQCDMIDDPEMLDYLEQDIRALLNEYDFDGNTAPVIRGSALKVLEGDWSENWIESIDELLATLDNVSCSLMCPGGYIPKLARA